MTVRPTKDILDDWYGFSSLRGLMDTAQDAIDSLIDHDAKINKLSLDLIEARNPGIDMEEVKRIGGYK